MDHDLESELPLSFFLNEKIADHLTNHARFVNMLSLSGTITIIDIFSYLGFEHEFEQTRDH